MKKIPLICVPILLLITACTPDLGQNLYTDKYTGVEKEIGHATQLEFATVIRAKEITIYRKAAWQSIGNDGITGLGVGVGAVAGGLIGATIGNGIGEIASIVGGVVIGGTGGEIAEQEFDKHKGYEYIIITEHKKTKLIIQYANPDDVVFKKGDRVMLETYQIREKQTSETQNKKTESDQFYDKFEKESHEEDTDQEKYWKYQRLIPANDLPNEVASPKGIKINNTPE